MRYAIWAVLVLSSSVSATPVTTFVDGRLEPFTTTSITVTGPGVSIVSAEDNGGAALSYGCRLEFSCDVGIPVAGDNGGGIDEPYIFATYGGFQLGRLERGSIQLSFGWSQYFGRDTKSGAITVPVDVVGRIQLGQPGTNRYFDLRLTGTGTQTLVAHVPDLTGAPESYIHGAPFSFDAGTVTFTGELTEAPEPSTAWLGLAGILAIAFRLRLNSSAPA